MNTKKTHTDPVKAFLAAIGSKGGSAGSRADKVRAARVRWDKAKGVKPLPRAEPYYERPGMLPSDDTPKP